jgi:hypothetical protein
MMQDHIQLKMIAGLTVLNLLQADTLASVSCMLGCGWYICHQASGMS